MWLGPEPPIHLFVFFCEGYARYLTKLDEMNLLTQLRRAKTHGSSAALLCSFV